MRYLARSDAQSYAWRQDFIATFLRRDLRDFGVLVPADTLHRFWRMLAHLQGQLFNASQLGMSLGGASHATATRYLATMVDAMVVRKLEPHVPNLGKRIETLRMLRGAGPEAPRARRVLRDRRSKRVHTQ